MLINLSVFLQLVCILVSLLLFESNLKSSAVRSRSADGISRILKQSFRDFGLKTNRKLLDQLQKHTDKLTAFRNYRKDRKSSAIQLYSSAFKLQSQREGPSSINGIPKNAQMYYSFPTGTRESKTEVTQTRSQTPNRHHHIDKLERRNPAVLLNPLLLPLRILLALIRILTLPLRILLAPLIVVLRVLIRFLIILVNLLNPLFYVVLFFQGLNIARTIVMIILRILRRILEREDVHHHDEHEEIEVITIVEDKDYMRRSDQVKLNSYTQRIGRRLRLMTESISHQRLVAPNITQSDNLKPQVKIEADHCLDDAMTYCSALELADLNLATEFVEFAATQRFLDEKELQWLPLDSVSIRAIFNSTRLGNLHCTEQARNLML